MGWDRRDSFVLQLTYELLPLLDPLLESRLWVPWPLLLDDG